MADEVRQVAAAEWHEAVAGAYLADPAWSFDWLGACDEIGLSDELRVVARLDRADGSGLRVETRVPRARPRLASLGDVVAGAVWHERETSDLYGVEFVGGDARPLLVAAVGSPGHPGGWPLRKDYVLGARAVTPWPGDSGEEGRRRQAPPGVPDPAVWGDRPVDAGPPDPGDLLGGRRRR